MSTSDSSSARSVITRFVVPLAATAIAFGAGWSLGAGKARTDWTDATVTVTGTSATATVGSTTYEADGSLPSWVDTDGTWRTGGWPTCLTDEASQTLPVAIGSTSVDRRTVTAWMAVDCSDT
jgi:hypothetical protein